MTPAERLLAATDLLDKRAGEATEGPWVAEDPYNSRTVADILAYNGPSGMEWQQVAFEVPIANAAYIATMHPEVGKALATWLRSAAANHREEGNDWTTSCTFCADEWMCADMTHARKIADLLLAGEA